MDVVNDGPAHVGYPVLDSVVTKYWALKLATDAALTVLRVDQVPLMNRTFRN
jgi:hypothetical protein